MFLPDCAAPSHDCVKAGEQMAEFLFDLPRKGRPTLSFGGGARHAAAGPIRVALLGRLHTWRDDGADIDAELAALAQRIEAVGLKRALAPADGEWGLIVEDTRTGTISFVTDHVGTHPVFLAETARGLTLGNRLPPVIRAAGLALDQDRAALYLSRGRKDSQQPLFAGARRLDARRILTVEPGGTVHETIWTDWDITASVKPDFETLRDLILGAIRYETASMTGPLAGSLSAGMDCSILTVATRDQPGFRAYSIDAGPGIDNEMAEIDETVRLTGIRHDYVRAGFGLEQLLALIGEGGEPVRELKSISTMFDCACRARSDGMGSFLIGLGPDMPFAGARMLVIPYLHALARRGALVEMARALPALAPYLGISRARLIGRYLSITARARDGMIQSAGKPNDGGRLKPAFARACPVVRPLDIKAFIAGMLSGVAIGPSVRAMGALTGLEIAAPLYSRRVAEYALSCDPRWLMQGGATKAMMRKALARDLPDHIVHAPVKKKVPHRPVDAIVFAPDAEAEIEALLADSPALREMVADDPVRGFRRDREAGTGAEFWGRCVQLARVEQLAGNAAAKPAPALKS